MVASEHGAWAAFLDKDGTVIEDVPYNVDPQQIRLLPGVLQGLRLLQNAGYRLVIVSNQSGVALGRFPEAALKDVEHRLRELLMTAGVKLDGFYYCPHHPRGIAACYARDCDCRKPQAGLILRAANELGIDVQKSWMIGDILNDIEAGRRAGCRTILVDRGNETEWRLSPDRCPHFTVSTFLDATERMISSCSSRKSDAIPFEAVP